MGELMPRWRAATFVLVLFVLAGCGGGTAWPKTAGETSCREWTGEMTGEQRAALGAAMLLALRENDGGTVRPRDDVLKAFATAVGDVCETTPDEKVSAVAATIYRLSDDLKP
jgi:hypothetical protein